MESLNDKGVVMEQPHHIAIARELDLPVERVRFSDARGGHMAYRRLFAETDDGHVYFIKGQDSSLFTEDERATHAQQYLLKEHMLFTYLLDIGYTSTPATSRFINDSYLMIEGLPVEHGWYWRAPRDDPELFDAYVRSVLASFDELQSLPLPPEEYFFPKRIMQVYMQEGWQYLTPEQIDKVRIASEKLRPELHESTEAVMDEALDAIASFSAEGQKLYDVARPLYLTHHDARQANIAWHPDRGVKNIDLSWADVGWKNSDATMLLIDLAKAGHDVSPYLDQYFNPDHALLLMGWWFGRCAEPTLDGNPIVRVHQLASALTAYQLLTM